VQHCLVGSEMCIRDRPEYEDLINSFAEAIDRDYVWRDLENDLFEQK
jgi:hypothetical protein